MKVIAGLGNPGVNYQNTRHNVGFWFVDQLVNQAGGRWHILKKHQTLESTPPKSDVLYVKPQTFMNESGKAVRAVKKEYGLKTENLLVVHDDLDLDPGAWKMQFNRSSAGHNGVQSIIDTLGASDFWRLRIGVGRPNKPGDEYVLEDPSKKDLELIKTAIAQSTLQVLEWLKE